MKKQIKKDILIASVVVAIVLVSVFAIYYMLIFPPHHDSSTPEIKLQKTITENWIILNVSSVDSKYDTPLIDFRLILDDNDVYDYQWASWELIDIKNSTESPKFVDNDNNNELSIGDIFFIPIDLSNTYTTILLHHIPTDSSSYSGEL